MDCEGKANDFRPTPDDALAFTIGHRLRSILQTEITASIIGGDTAAKRREHRGRRWLIQIGSYSGIPGHRFHGVPQKKALNSVIKDRWTSLDACTRVILD